MLTLTVSNSSTIKLKLITITGTKLDTILYEVPSRHAHY